MIGHTEKTTSWGSGIEQMSIGFVKYTLQRHRSRSSKSSTTSCSRPRATSANLSQQVLSAATPRRVSRLTASLWGAPAAGLDEGQRDQAPRKPARRRLIRQPAGSHAAAAMNKLCKLLADNRRMPQRRFEIAASGDGSEAEIFLYDAIVSDEAGGRVVRRCSAAVLRQGAARDHGQHDPSADQLPGWRCLRRARHRAGPAGAPGHRDRPHRWAGGQRATFVAMAADRW